MKQFSNDGTPIQLELISGDLLFIDPLYFQDIINHKDDVEYQCKEDNALFVKSLEETVFPYGGGMLLGYRRVKPENNAYIFNLQKIRQFDHKDDQLKALSFNKEITAFATDSGTLLILDMANFDKLILSLMMTLLTLR